MGNRLWSHVSIFGCPSCVIKPRFIDSPKVIINYFRTKMQQSNANDAASVIVEEKVVRFNGDIAIKRYTRGRFLGKGGFARCYEFTN